MFGGPAGAAIGGALGGAIGGSDSPENLQTRVEPWSGAIPYLTGLGSNAYFNGGIPDTWGPWWNWVQDAQNGAEGSWLRAPPPMVPQDPRLTGENVHWPTDSTTPEEPEAPSVNPEELDRIYATLDLQAMAAGNGMSLPSQMAGYQWANNPYTQGMGSALSNLQGITGRNQALGVSGINPG